MTLYRKVVIVFIKQIKSIKVGEQIWKQKIFLIKSGVYQEETI